MTSASRTARASCRPRAKRSHSPSPMLPAYCRRPTGIRAAINITRRSCTHASGGFRTRTPAAAPAATHAWRKAPSHPSDPVAGHPTSTCTSSSTAAPQHMHAGEVIGCPLRAAHFAARAPVLTAPHRTLATHRVTRSGAHSFQAPPATPGRRSTAALAAHTMSSSAG